MQDEGARQPASGAAADRRVVHVVWRLGTGGVQRVIEQSARALVGSPIDLRVVTIRPTDRDDPTLPPAVGIDSLGLGWDRPRRPWWRLALIAGVRRTLRAARPDVVHLHSGTGWLGIGMVALRPRPALVLEVHDAPGSGRSGRAAEWLERRLLRATGGIALCHSREVAAALVAHGVPEHRTVRFPLCVPEGFLAASGGPVDTADRVGPPGIRLITVGRLVPSKCIESVLEVAAALDRPDRPVSLTVVGDGPERAPLEAAAARSGLRGAVRFTGTIEDHGELVGLLRSADVAVSMSAYEGFGLATAEAMAVGVPVVATAVGGVVDVVEDGVTGLLVPAGDVESATAAVERLMGDAALRARLVDAARADARARFSPTALGDNLTALYGALGGRSGAGSPPVPG